MTGVAIVHVYPDQDYTFSDSPPIDRREVVGAVVRTNDETNENFDNRVARILNRLRNLTWSEKLGDAANHPLAGTIKLDNKVYNGYLETETVEILEDL